MDIPLDVRIRDWVLIPIVVVMFIIAILRHNITKLLRTDNKKTTPNDLKAIKEAQILLRARRLRANANKLPPSSFLMRRFFFNSAENGIFKDKGPSSATNQLMSNPMMDPSNMVDMMKKKHGDVCSSITHYGLGQLFLFWFYCCKTSISVDKFIQNNAPERC